MRRVPQHIEERCVVVGVTQAASRRGVSLQNVKIYPHVQDARRVAMTTSHCAAFLGNDAAIH